MSNITWHCQIILKNTSECSGVVDCLVTHVVNKIYHDCHGRPYADQRKARICVLSQFLEAYVEEVTDAGNEYRLYDPMTRELVLGAIQEVDFRAIAEDLIGDYSPKSPDEIAENEENFEIMGFGNYDIDED